MGVRVRMLPMLTDGRMMVLAVVRETDGRLTLRDWYGLVTFGAGRGAGGAGRDGGVDGVWGATALCMGVETVGRLSEGRETAGVVGRAATEVRAVAIIVPATVGPCVRPTLPGSCCITGGTKAVVLLSPGADTTAGVVGRLKVGVVVGREMVLVAGR